MRKGNRSVSRWLWGYDGHVPRSVRLPFFAVALVILGATYASTGSEVLQFLALCALVFGLLPALGRRFGRRDEETAAFSDGAPPFRVNVLSAAVWITWAALILLAAPDLGLGPWFWYWLLLWPCLEVQTYLGEHDLRRHGVESWKPFRPVRHSALLSLAAAPFYVLILVLQDVAAGEAVATGIACGFIVFAIAVTFAWLIRRANPADDRPRGADPDF